MDDANTNGLNEMSDEDLILAAQNSYAAEKRAGREKERYYTELRLRAGVGGRVFVTPEVIAVVGEVRGPVMSLNIPAVREHFGIAELEELGLVREGTRAQRVQFIPRDDVLEINVIAEEEE